MELSDLDERLNEYLKTGEISSRLSQCATMAVHDAERNWEGIRPDRAAYERSKIETLSRIAAAVEDMYYKVKEFEFKHWMGFCDEDVQVLLELKRRWDNFDWKDQSKKAEQEVKKLRALWDTASRDMGTDKDYWKPTWQQYIDRRDKKPLQEFIASPRSAKMDHLEVLMLGTAGRVLITVRDRYKQSDKRSKYGGAWITMIFDESSPYPRGGLQGQCSTRDEGVGLLQAVIDNMPTLTPDSKVSVGF